MYLSTVVICTIIFFISLYYFKNKKIAIKLLSSFTISLISFLIIISYASYEQNKREYLSTIYGFKIGSDLPKKSDKGKSFDLLFKEVDFQGVAGDRNTNKKIDAIYLKKDFINENECPIAFKKQWKLLTDKYPLLIISKNTISNNYYYFEVKPLSFKMRCHNKRLEVLIAKTNDRSLDEAYYYGIIR